MRKALLLILGIFLLKASFATDPVVDNADLFSAADEEQLSEKLGEVRRNNNGVIFIYTVASLAGRNVYDYSMEVGKSLGLGAKGLNNGLLLFIAPNDRKIQLLVGSGLEWSVPDEVSGTVISAMMTYYKERRFLAGTLAGIGLLQEKLGTAYVSVNDVSWEEMLTSPGRFAGGVVRFRLPTGVKLGNCLRPEPGHAQFDKGFNLKLEGGKQTLSLRYTKYMRGLINDIFTNRPVTIFARIEESTPRELKLMGVLKEE
jgi:uncharacterized protein